MTFENRNIVKEHSEDALTRLGGGAARAQGRAESSLVLTHRALHMPSLAVASQGESTLHLSPVPSLSHGLGMTAMVQRDDRSWNAQVLAGQTMIGLGIKAAVGQHAFGTHVSRRLSQRRRPRRGIVAWTATRVRADDQVRPMVRRPRHLGPIGHHGGPLITRPSITVMLAGVVGLEAGGVDGKPRLVSQQPPGAGPIQDRPQEAIKTPFFSSRCSA